MGTLNQEVSELTKGLHHMLHLLQAHISMHHYKVSHPSYLYGNQMASMPTAPEMSLNPPSTYHHHNDPTSHEGYGLQGIQYSGHWSCGAAAETRTETHFQSQSSSPPANPCPASSVHSGPRLGPRHGSESMNTHLWTSPSLLSISPGFQVGSPGHAPHAGHETSENRPLSGSPTTISQSQPTLCLQPPNDSEEYSCLLSSAPTGMSTHSLLDSSPSSYPHVCLPTEPHVNSPQGTQEDICALMSTPTCHLIQDSSIFQIKDSHPSILPVSASPTLSGLPAGSSLDSGSPQSDALEPHLPLGDPSAIEHTSLECLLGNGGSMESRDSESASSRRSSIGVQTQSTEQSWCLDLTD